MQRVASAELVSQHALSLSDALNQRLSSVTINDVQSNPLQPDLQYRGFTASPLIGTPQGISIYQNGQPLSHNAAVPGGRSVGVPGNLRMMALAEVSAMAASLRLRVRRLTASSEARKSTSRRL